MWFARFIGESDLAGWNLCDALPASPEGGLLKVVCGAGLRLP